MTTGALLGRAQFARAAIGGQLAVDDEEGPVARLIQRHGVPPEPAARVAFFTELLLGAEPSAPLRAALVATASAPGPRSCEAMVTQLCLSPAFHLG